MGGVDHCNVRALHGDDRKRHQTDMARQGHRDRRTLAVDGEHVGELDQRLPAVEVEADQEAGDRVGEVVVAAGAMIDRVLAAARGAPLEAAELGRQARQVEQLDPTGVQKRQQVVKEVALRPGGLLELDPVLGETCARPFAGVVVAKDLRHAVTAQKGGELRHRGLGVVSGRRILEQRVENAGVVAAEMPDRQRHRIRAATRRVDKGGIGHPRLRRKLMERSPHGHRVHRLAGDESARSVRNSAPYSALADSGSSS